MKASLKTVFLSAIVAVLVVCFFRIDFMEVRILGDSEGIRLSEACKGDIADAFEGAGIKNGFSKFTRIVGFIAAGISVLCVIEALTESDDQKAGSTLCVAAGAMSAAYGCLTANAFILGKNFKDKAKDYSDTIAAAIKYNPTSACYIMLVLAAGLLLFTYKDSKSV